jgi:hypothetical protein
MTAQQSMADSELSLGPIRILSPTTGEEWHHADVLISELKEWDVQQSRALGFDRDEVLSVFYPGDTGDIRRDSVPPMAVWRTSSTGQDLVKPRPLQ